MGKKVQSLELKSRKDLVLNTEKSKHRAILENNKEQFLKHQQELVQNIRRQNVGRKMGFCMGIHSPWSKGKTLTETFIAKERNETEGTPVVANFRIKSLSSFRFLDDIEIIREIKETILMIDEIRRYMDSYMSRGQKARFISNLTADLGKQSCDFYYADQHYNAAPPRVKVNLSMIASPDFDEGTQWVTVYLFMSIEDYLMFNPFFYFGFYGPDYWDYYKTEFKIEDFKLKFNYKKYANMFLVWSTKENWVKGVSKKTLIAWNQAEGMEFSQQEITAILTYLQATAKKEREGLKSGGA